MRFFDTGPRKYVELGPVSDVRIYVCGITPYDSAHLGHVFTFVTYDLLMRRLEDAGAQVSMVRNVTDVDEPIFERARENGETYEDLAARETAEFREAMTQLNLRPPAAEPMVSDYIDRIAEAVGKLMNDGFGYRLGQDVYFDTSRVKDFGQLSRYSPRLKRLLMADRGGDPDRPGKRQPLDFMLWRGVSDPADRAAWDTPIGRGRPGWHIECSVMGAATTGGRIDIHGGGTDLIFPHHDSELAQNEALKRADMVKHWLHVAPMAYGGDKMSKSLGNLIFARDLLKLESPTAVRLAMLNYQHRTGGEWLDDNMDRARELEADLRSAMAAGLPEAGSLLAKIRAALDDDLDAPHALGCIRKYADRAKSGEKPAVGAVADFRKAMGLVGVQL